jgi:cephalosporin-C deacetylase-like acetyl esterase
MFSRRRFLQTNLAGLALTLPGSETPDEGGLGRPDSPPPDKSSDRAYWDDWPTYLIAEMNEARARRKAALAALSSEAQVRQRIEMVRKKVWELIGGPFEKTPLNPVVVGTIERKTYRIEKVIFESHPQVFVTAHLYVPTLAPPPFPGILAPLGHTSNGKEYRNYQYLYQTLARKGYMVLAFDPFGQGERKQYLDPKTGESLYGSTGEHSQAGRQLLLLGATFAQYRAWDGIRALDYLLSRPEVDPQRIGCTGHSGGGTMTMYLAALEPRIQVAVEVEGNSENLAGPAYDPPGAVADAEQNLVGSLPLGIDRGDLLLAFAPKPLFLIYTPQDAGTTYSPVYEQGTREIFEELQKVYSLLAAKDEVGLFASPLPHDFDFFCRRATYDWFNRWLAKKDLGTDETEFESAPPQVLNCTSTGQVLTSLGGRSLVGLNAERARALVPAALLSDASLSPQALRDRLREKLRSLLALPQERGSLEARVLSSNRGQGRTVEEFDFRSEAQIRVPGWFVKPLGKDGPFPTMLYVSEQGKDGVMEEPSQIDEVLRHGFAVCAVDLRGLGITAPRYPAAGPLFYGFEDPDIKDGYAWACLTLGKPVLGQRVRDFLRCLDYLESRADVDHPQTRVLGVGGGGLVSLMGAVLDDRPRAILLHQTLADFRSVVEAGEYSSRLPWFVSGILREMDLPYLVAALAPRPCWLLNATGPKGETLSISQVKAGYKASLDFYSRAGRGSQLRFLVQPDGEIGKVFLSWLRES